MLQGCSCPYIGSSRTRDCHCTKPDEYYQSPLFQVHWKRLIVDEGHSMSATNTNSIIVAGRLKVQSKWIVTGTPSGGLHTRYEDDPEEDNDYHGSKLEVDDLQRLGNICTNFLELMPYTLESNLKWRELSSEVVENILSKVMIRHQPCDTEQLPPLHRKIVRIKPSYYDKLSLNLFSGALASNAILSEREGKDYLFDPNQKSQVRALVNNLRAASFWWTGWKADDLSSLIDNIKEFTEKRKEKNYITSHDSHLLQESIKYAIEALESSSWKYFSEFDEMGYMVSGLSKKDCIAWTSFTPVPGRDNIHNTSKHNQKQHLSILRGKTILEMQKYISSKAFSSSIDLDQFRQHGIEFKSFKTKPQVSKKSPTNANLGPKSSFIQPNPGFQSKPFFDEYLPKNCHLQNAYITATASAKLTYIINKVLEVYQTEKIIIFFDNANTGYHLADTMMLLGIDYLLYVGGLPHATKAEYLTTFNTSERFRVFLMDINQGSTGIDLYSASRIIFVNPLWKPPSVEAQAIKRAHRLGQTKPVYVETLVLQDTIEEQIYNRRLEMSDSDFKSRRSIIDDEMLQGFLKNMGFLDIRGDESHDRWIPLDDPQKVFEEEKAGEFPEDPDAGIIKLVSPKSKEGKKKRVVFNDDDVLATTIENLNSREEQEDSSSFVQPPTKKRRVAFDLSDELEEN